MRNRNLGRLAGGGSSILVVFLMLLLVTLGVLAMVSSDANLKLARKGVSWIKGYYMLEAGGEALLDTVSQGLIHADNLRYTEGNAFEGALGRLLADYLGEYVDGAGKKLPYGAVINEIRVEPDGSGSVTVTAMLSREHESIDQHLLVQAMVFAGTGESDTGGFRILQWKQYQEPFEYETKLELWK